MSGNQGQGTDTRAQGVYVQSLARGLAVIRAFDADAPALSLSDVARRTGLTRAAARRFLLTLVELGYVRTDGRVFTLTPRVLELGFAYLSSLCNAAFTATQYALFSSLAAVPARFLAAPSGWFVDQFSWIPFFLLATLACLPSLFLLVWLRRRVGIDAPAPVAPAE